MRKIDNMDKFQLERNKYKITKVNIIILRKLLGISTSYEKP